MSLLADRFSTNPLAPNDGSDVADAVNHVVESIRAKWADSGGVFIEETLRSTLTLVAEANRGREPDALYTMQDAVAVLGDSVFRAALLDEAGDESLRYWWRHRYRPMPMRRAVTEHCMTMIARFREPSVPA